MSTYKAVFLALHKKRKSALVRMPDIGDAASTHSLTQSRFTMTATV
ncbi:MAG: hypothetical protein HKK66_02555 [Chlorobiaceae bacterium]|nr:hypothetical protein [Chlorobiaceae bacterium]